MLSIITPHFVLHSKTNMMVTMIVKTMAITNESNHDSNNGGNDNNNNAYCKNGINKIIWGLEKREKLISIGDH